jgi:hypothetical protein
LVFGDALLGTGDHSFGKLLLVSVSLTLSLFQRDPRRDHPVNNFLGGVQNTRVNSLFNTLGRILALQLMLGATTKIGPVTAEQWFTFRRLD